MCELFLKRDNGKYFIYVLGKNGEPRVNANVSLRIVNPKFMVFSEKEVSLYTNNDGKIELGHLKNCLAINATCSSLNISNEWHLNPFRSQTISLPDSLDSVEGVENIEFSVLTKK